MDCWEFWNVRVAPGVHFFIGKYVGVVWDDVADNGNYYLGYRVWGLGLCSVLTGPQQIRSVSMGLELC